VTGRLQGKIALVTGAGSGIGRAAAELFAAEGAVLAALDMDGPAAERTAAAIVSSGGRAVGVEADVGCAEQVGTAVAHTVEALGRLDVLYNNAAIDVGGSVLDATEADWDRCFQVNVRGPFLCSRAAVPHLAEVGGVIVNAASAAGLIGVRDLAAYSASKGAVISLTRSMAIDLAPLGIRVNAICPGAVHTPMLAQLMRRRGAGDAEAAVAGTLPRYPLGRMGRPADIARLALFLASPEASFLTGAVISLDGGLTAQ
jgi:NAD(P)-dependent dehydrogenase (short-subunit alcohol dehydrogenase family)